MGIKNRLKDCYIVLKWLNDCFIHIVKYRPKTIFFIPNKEPYVQLNIEHNCWNQKNPNLNKQNIFSSLQIIMNSEDLKRVNLSGPWEASWHVSAPSLCHQTGNKTKKLKPGLLLYRDHNLASGKPTLDLPTNKRDSKSFRALRHNY